MEQLQMLQMSVDEFMSIQDNPIQRDTVTHARARSRAGGNLAALAPTHCKVAIATTKNGDRYKLDGHSRAYLWGQGHLERPEVLYVDNYQVDGLEDVKAVYAMHDSDQAVERPRDKLYGAFRMYHFDPVHPFMFQQTGLITTMKLLTFPAKYSDANNLSMYELIEPWIPTCQQINKLDPYNNHFIFPSYITCAQYLSVLRDGASALSFWQEFHDGGGTRTRISETAYYTARQLQRDIKANKEHGGSHSHGFIRMVVPSFLWLYEQWARGKRIPNNHPPLLGKKFRRDLPTLSQWWRTNIGEYFYPQIRGNGK